MSQPEVQEVHARGGPRARQGRLLPAVQDGDPGRRRRPARPAEERPPAHAAAAPLTHFSGGAAASRYALTSLTSLFSPSATSTMCLATVRSSSLTSGCSEFSFLFSLPASSSATLSS